MRKIIIDNRNVIIDKGYNGYIIFLDNDGGPIITDINLKNGISKFKEALLIMNIFIVNSKIIKECIDSTYGKFKK